MVKGREGVYSRNFEQEQDLDDKESACNAGDMGLIPGSERSPGEENGNPLQYSCLENSMVRGVWQQVTLHVAAKGQT